MSLYFFLLKISILLFLSCSKFDLVVDDSYPLLSSLPKVINQDLLNKKIQKNDIGDSHRLYVGESSNLKSYAIFSWEYPFEEQLCLLDSLILDSVSLDFKVNNIDMDNSDIINSFNIYNFNINDISWSEDSLNYNQLISSINQFEDSPGEQYSISDSESLLTATFQKHAISDSIMLKNSVLCKTGTQQILLIPKSGSPLIEFFSANSSDIENRPRIAIHCKEYKGGEWTYTILEVIGMIQDISIYNQELIEDVNWSMNYAKGARVFINLSSINKDINNTNQKLIVTSELNLGINKSLTNISNDDAILLIYTYINNGIEQFLSSQSITKEDSLITISLDAYFQNIINDKTYSDSIMIRSSGARYNFDNIVIYPNGAYNQLEILYIGD